MASDPRHGPLLTTSQLARAIRRSTGELHRRWLKTLSVDCVVGSGTKRRYTLDAIAEIVAGIERRAMESGRAGPDGEDADLAGDSSPALERYRMARAEQAELDLEVRRGRLLDREKLEAQWVAGAVALRNAGERLQRRFGDEAADLFNEGVQDFARVVNGAIHGGSQHTPADDVPERVERPGRAVDDRPPAKPEKVRRGRAGRPKRPVRGGEVPG